VQQPVRGDDLLLRAWRSAVESAHTAAWLLHDRHERRVVPGGEPRIDGCIDGTFATSACCQKSPSERACQAARSTATRSRPYIDDTEASARRGTAETRILSPSLNAPSPRAAHQRWPSPGEEMTPQTTWSSRSSAIRVAHTGTPREKFFVPSIGSMTHRTPASSPPSSSPKTPSPGRLPPIRSRSARSTAGLGLDAQVERTEARQAERVGEVGKLEGEGKVGGGQWHCGTACHTLAGTRRSSSISSHSTAVCRPASN
jgi:hypothetical protein